MLELFLKCIENILKKFLCFKIFTNCLFKRSEYIWIRFKNFFLIFLKRSQNVFKPFVSGHFVRFKNIFKMFSKMFPRFYETI